MNEVQRSATTLLSRRVARIETGTAQDRQQQPPGQFLSDQHSLQTQTPNGMHSGLVSSCNADSSMESSAAMQRLAVLEAYVVSALDDNHAVHEHNAKV